MKKFMLFVVSMMFILSSTIQAQDSQIVPRHKDLYRIRNGNVSHFVIIEKDTLPLNEFNQKYGIKPSSSNNTTTTQSKTVDPGKQIVLRPEPKNDEDNTDPYNFSNDGEPDMSFNKEYIGTYADDQDFDATKLLYKEVNTYRSRYGLPSLRISPRVVGYACRWGNYMVSKDYGVGNTFYKHSKFGPEEYHLPSNCSENIHLIYFDHRPTPLEMVHGLMYGIPRDGGNVVGWTQSEGHNHNILQDIVKYYGMAVYVIRVGNIYAVYGIQNFSTIK